MCGANGRVRAQRVGPGERDIGHGAMGVGWAGQSAALAGPIWPAELLSLFSFLLISKPFSVSISNCISPFSSTHVYHLSRVHLGQH